MTLTAEDLTINAYSSRVTGWAQHWSDRVLIARVSTYEAVGLQGAADACWQEIRRRCRAADVERILDRANRAMFNSWFSRRNRGRWAAVYQVRMGQLKEALESCSRH